MHVLPEAQVAHPVQLVPPHCPYFAVGVQPEVAEVVGFADDEDVVVVVLGVVIGVVFVVLGGVMDVVDVVDMGGGGGGWEVPVPLHPTRAEEMEISSYQNVLASPPYDSQPK